MQAMFFRGAAACATIWAMSAAAWAGPLKAGAATSNLTPPLGGAIVGGFSPIPATHVHDELHARCLVLDDGKTRLAWVVCDLLGLGRGVSDEARRLIAAETGIPREAVLLTATHTHSATSALGKSRYKDGELDDYQRFVARRIADGVRRASNLLRPAELAFGTAEAPEHLFNRRWKMRPGTVPDNPFGGTDLVKMNPPPGSPNLVEPAGPTDPTIRFLAVREPAGKPLALFATYSLHYVGGVGPGHVSADYFAYFCKRIERLQEASELDPPFVAALANGTSGDVNNIDFLKPRPRRAPYEQMRIVADDVAGKVQAALPGLTYRGDLVLDARYREPVLPWRKPTADQRAWAERTLAAGRKSGQDLSYIYAERTQAIADLPDTTVVPIQVLRIGDVRIGTLPCEIFTETGLDFARRAGGASFLTSLGHGYYGYLPTPRQHDLGGYETWLGTNRLERDASEKLLEQLLEMAAELQPEPAPAK